MTATPPTVLIVDDEERNRLLFSGQLESEGCRALLASDGEEALRILARDIPDTVLLDVMMPRMDGYEVCRAIRGDPRTAHVPVLMVTALSERQDRLKGIEVGANDFLTKPVDATDLRLRVRNAVHGKRLHDQVQADLHRLKELENLRDGLVHMLIHDLRNPLTVITMTLELVSLNLGELADSRPEALRHALTSCHHMKAMLDAMLDVSRMEAGQMPLNRERYDLLDLCGEAAQSVEPQAGGKRIELRVAGRAAHAMMDREIMRRVVVNLLGNAVRFSPAASTVDVEVSAEDETAGVRVRDRGCGIAPEDQARVFDKFGQTSGDAQTKHQGFGLGLTFCRLAVEAHGGRIGVDSVLGAGSTFFFTLPLAQSQHGHRESGYE